MNPGWSIRNVSTRQLVEELARRQDVDVRRRKRRTGEKPVTILIDEEEPV